MAVILKAPVDFGLAVEDLLACPFGTESGWR
jgi:hypothetical protein